MIVAVTGATGYVGWFIVKHLIAEGLQVRAWRRASSDISGLPRDVGWIEGDLDSPASMNALVDGADMLVHAALSHVPGRYRGGEGDDPTRFWKLNVDGSAMLLEAARKAGVKRAVVLSSRAVFGETVEGVIEDDAKPAPDTHYGAVKAELEAWIKKFAKDWPATVLRPTGIYGIVEPVERSKWFGLVRDVLDGAEVPARAGTEVHGEDVARATWTLLIAPPDKVAGRAFNCSDILVSNRDIVETVQGLAKVDGPLPDAGAPPKAILGTDGLKALGVSFGGKGRFEETVRALVAAALRRPAG